MIKYQIVKCETMVELEKEVNRLISEGWSPQGEPGVDIRGFCDMGVTRIPRFEPFVKCYYQAMVYKPDFY